MWSMEHQSSSNPPITQKKRECYTFWEPPDFGRLKKQPRWTHSPSPRHPTHLDLRSALWPCLFSFKLPPGAVLWHRNAQGFQQAKRWCMVVVVAIGIAVTSTVVEEPGPALLEGMILSGEFISHRCVSKDVDVISTWNSSVKRIRLRYLNKLYKII